MWQGFCAFAQRPVVGRDPDADEDLLLFECAAESAQLIVDLVRQFTEGGDDGAMEQLRCSVTLSLSDATAQPSVPAPIWAQAATGAAGWIAEVEATCVFTTAVSADAMGVVVSQSFV